MNAEGGQDAYHVPVMASQVVEHLVTNRDGIYLDCTVGGGGHSRLIIERLSADGTLIACDRDAEAIAAAREVLPSSTQFFQIAFSEMERSLVPKFSQRLSGVFMDLGVSSHQIDDPARGFSHRFSGPLDLRMNPSAGETAAELLARLDVRELADLIREYGEDSQANRIAKAIGAWQRREPIADTQTLTRVISESVPATRNKSLARVFQALRIEVNHEIEELEAGLQAVWHLLAEGGRLAVLTYHSIEDRIVKEFMRSKASPNPGRPVHPLTPRPAPTGRLIMRKPLTPTLEEIQINPRARSAKLRVVERIAQ